MGIFDFSRKPKKASSKGATAPRDPWKSEVYQLLRRRFALEPEDVSDFVDPESKEKKYRSMSPDDYVHDLEKRFGFFRVF